ncbi:MAG TPA: hypothetical protein VMW05_01960 [Methyloceanibacter sp.]|nr:hypothetical protein [Methyloceanibacter sp.]
MADHSDEDNARAAPKKTDARQARLEQALRANLLKRKANTKAKEKAGKAERSPPEEGGQAEG